MQKARRLQLVMMLFLAPALPALTQSKGGQAMMPEGEPHIAGVWRGNSVCTVPDSPCHDEENIYNVLEIVEKPASFLIVVSKVVDGKEIAMGSGEWKYDAEKHTLQSESALGTFLLTVNGNTMEGTLTRRDKTVYRRIHLTKQNLKRKLS